MPNERATFRAPQPGDPGILAANLRPADWAECVACGHTDVVANLRDGLRRSPLAWAGTVDGHLALLMGVAPLGTLLSDTGVPWMLGTPLVTRYQKAFMRQAPGYISQMLGLFPHLLNVVHAENKVAIGWLRHMGFTLAEAQPYGPHGALFHRFEAFRHVQSDIHPLGRHGRFRSGPGRRRPRSGRLREADGAAEPADRRGAGG